MRRLLLILLSLSWLIAGWSSTPLLAQDAEPVVHAVMFWSKTCPHCHEVLNETFLPLQEQYGSQLDIRAFELSDPASYELVMAAVEAFQVPVERREVPMLFIGDTVLIGSIEIPEQLPGLIEQHLVAGGLDYPAIPGLLANLSPATPTPPPTQTTKATAIPDEDQVPTNTPAPTPDRSVHLWLFYGSHCASCKPLLEDILPPILWSYEKGQVVVQYQDLERGGFALKLALERQYGLEHGALPEIFIGEYALLGSEEIEARLPDLIDQYLAQGGVALTEAEISPTPTPVPAETAGEAPTIHLAYFYQPGCQECDRVQLALDYFESRYPQLSICAFDAKDFAVRLEWLGERAGVPVSKRLTAPAVFAGDEGLVGEEVHARSLEDMLSRYVETGSDQICTGWEETSGEMASGIVERFRSFGLLTILGAGLVDGLNPCAFATLVFFVSYLTFMGRRGREVLASGAAFALGVFLTYLGVGLGALKFLSALPFLSAISRWVYGLTAALCLVLAAGSLYDWWQARRGKLDEMRLRLPPRLRRWINRAVREGAATSSRGIRTFVPITFVTGVVISVIELACTGQVYLPTILFVLGVPELRVQAGLYLLLYNLMFVVPLVIVFVLAYFGTTSQQLGLFIRRHTAKVKLATAGLFVLLTIWMVVSLL